MTSITRRSFIKGTAVLLCSTAVPDRAESSGKISGEPHATLHDLRKCIGCGECVEACREENRRYFPEPSKPFPRMYPSRVKAEDWSDMRDERERLTPYNWLTIQQAEVTTDQGNLTVFIPRRCMHCVNPPCVKLCPWGAAYQKKNGLSVINPDICLGGAKCQNVCPWDIPQRQTGVGLYLDIMPAFAGNGVMYKCHRCHEKVERGENPACIDVCPEHVQTIGPRSEIVAKSYEIARETGGYVYGDRENGGTNTIYVSPVPFDSLNQAIHKGKGLPDLERKKDVMADGNTMAAALFFAPIAGIAAAVSRFIFTMKQTNGNKSMKRKEETHES